MNYSVLLLVVFTITAIENEGTEALTVVNMETAFSPVQVKDPWWGSSSSGILKSHTIGSYFTGRVRNLTLSAPLGYGIVAAIRTIDLRPNSVDTLTLSSVGTRPVTYTNIWSYRDRTYDSRETSKTFSAPNGKLVVTFVTGSSFVSSFGYDGFQLTFTSYSTDPICGSGEFQCSNRRCIANILTCDGHNHCGDGSDQFPKRSCSFGPPPNVAGIVCGVIFLLIAVGCAVFIIVRRARRNAQTVSATVVTSHPPPATYQPPVQPGTYYPPPPPQYSQYPQGHVNPAYR